jgi:hypothetical protein
VLQSRIAEPGNLMPPAHHTRAAEWAAMMSTTQSEAHVLRMAAEYLATWLPSDLEQLPAECRTGRLQTVDDVGHLAVTFTQSELSTPPGTPAASTLASLALVFIAAQNRLRQLRSPRFDPAAS